MKNIFSRGGSSNQSNLRNYSPQVMPQGMGNMQTQRMPGGSNVMQMPNFTPQQIDMFNQLAQQGMQGMGNLPSADFSKIRPFYEQNLMQNIVPGIAERFSGLGAGSQRSSAFEQSLGSAAGQNQAQLAAMEQMFNQQNRQSEIGRLMSMLQFGAQPQFQYFTEPPDPGFLRSAMPGLLSGLGSALGGAAKYGAPMLQSFLANKYPTTFGTKQ